MDDNKTTVKKVGKPVEQVEPDAIIKMIMTLTIVSGLIPAQVFSYLVLGLISSNEMAFRPLGVVISTANWSDLTLEACLGSFMEQYIEKYGTDDSFYEFYKDLNGNSFDEQLEDACSRLTCAIYGYEKD